MSIIGRRPYRVKPHRHSPRKPGRFGAGLLRSLPNDRIPCTMADLRWAAEAFGGGNSESRWDAETVLESRAEEAAMLDRIAAGYCL